MASYQLVSILLVLFLALLGVKALEDDYLDDSSFFITPFKTTFVHAPEACKRSGGILANLSEKNLQRVSSQVSKSFGPLSRAWVHSWVGVTYGNSCLALSTGTGPLGVINVQPDCNTPLHAICQSS